MCMCVVFWLRFQNRRYCIFRKAIRIFVVVVGESLNVLPNGPKIQKEGYLGQKRKKGELFRLSAHVVLCVACCVLRVVCCVSRIKCYALRVACCVLRVVCCVSRVAFCVLCGVSFVLSLSLGKNAQVRSV